MGEVWRATDEKLGREVALKVLPEEFAKDPDRYARFEREAKVLASLNHPNIAHLYGLETSHVIPSEAKGRVEGSPQGREGWNPQHSPETSGDPSTPASPSDASAQDDRGSGSGREGEPQDPRTSGPQVHFLVMELVEGEDLSERIARGAIPVDEAIPVAIQIAEALEAAHEAGIVHRDLKPANIKLAEDGTVKVLDFGLAKAWETETGDSSLSLSPTMTTHRTVEGVILGTAAYMSPDQARGKKVDRRADIWAYGVVLWEMLTGRKLFEGDTVTDVLAAVLTSEPDLDQLPEETPIPVRRLLGRCLTRDPRQRLQWVGDARLDLESDFEREPVTSDRPVARSRAPWALAIVGVAFGLIAAVWSLLQVDGTASQPLHLEVSDAGFTSYSMTAISPDGSRVAFVANNLDGASRLRIRRIDNFDVHEVSDSGDAENPFFSPDGEWVAFFNPQARAVEKVALDGGSVQRLPGIHVWGFFNSGTWHPDGYLILTGAVIEGDQWQGLVTVPDSGGEVEVLTTLEANERRHYLPEVLPDSPWVLFTYQTEDGQAISAVSLETGERKLVLEDATTAKYYPSGYLVAFRPGQNDLVVAEFDAATATLEGRPRSVLTDVGGTTRGTGQYAIAENGTLIYNPPTVGAVSFNRRDILLVDREGNTEEIETQPSAWTQPRFSANGKKLLLRRILTPNCDLWTIDLDRRTTTRITFEHDTHDPLWNPNGEEVVYAGDHGARRAIFRTRADGSGLPEVMVEADVSIQPASWTPDGRLLALGAIGLDGVEDVWVLDSAVGPEPRPFLTSRFGERHPSFSADGRWIAYSSDESGHWEVFVRPYPGPGGRVQVSTDGGVEPLWSADGSELFYRSNEKLLVVAVSVDEGRLHVGAPEVLVDDNFERMIGLATDQRSYDVAPDGLRFAVIREDPAYNTNVPLRMVVRWFDSLRADQVGR